MKRLTILISVVSFLIFSCRDTSKDKKALPGMVTDSTAIDSTENIDTVLTAENFTFFNRSGFSAKAKSSLPSFDWSKFKLVNVYKDDSLLTAPFEPSREFYEAYGRYLKYSPDSSMFIDLDSYNIEIERGKTGQWVGTEKGPDTEVSLIDLQSKKRKRLVFLGPGGSVEDAAWLDNDNVVLVGVQEDGDGEQSSAVLWKYHLPTNTFFLYEMPDSVSADKLIGSWRKERLKGLKLR